MWEYRNHIYYQDNIMSRLELEPEISKFNQGNFSLEQYYFGFINLWSEYSGIIYSKVSKETLANLQEIHEVSKRDWFFMKLRPQ